MKKYQIVKFKDNRGICYAVANKEDIKQYKNTHFLPYEIAMKYKKYLIEHIEKSEKFKNNVDYKTIFMY